MITLQESFDADLSNRSRSFKKPSVTEVLAWAEQWAHHLRLWGGLEPEDALEPQLHPLKSSRSEYRDLASHLQSEIDGATTNQFNFRSVQNHPEVRKEANTIVDNLLREADASEQDIVRLKQILPYKVAVLHQIRSPRPEINKVPVWIYKKQINLKSSNEDKQDLLQVFLDANISFVELLKQLHQIVHPGRSTSRTVLLNSDWEYTLIQGLNTQRSENNSGFIKALSDWKKISNLIMSPQHPSDKVIIFQRHDMHQRYTPATIYRDPRDIGMARLQNLIDSAKKAGKDNNNAAASSSSTDLELDNSLQLHSSALDPTLSTSLQSGESDEQDRLEYILDEINHKSDNALSESFPKFEADIEQESVSPAVRMLPKLLDTSESGHNPGMSTGSSQARKQDHKQNTPSTVDQTPEQSRYITVWLEHDGVVDTYFECPAVESARPNANTADARPWNRWYFKGSI